MSTFVRKNLVFAWLVLVSVALGALAWQQAQAQRKVTTFDEINVQRINIVEPDGKPRVIISNRASMAGLYWGGREYKHHSRDDGGFLFFNDNGDEIGGFIFRNRSKDGDQWASTSLLFDQYQQQETLGLIYSEENRQRQAGLHVWDQPDHSIFPAVQMSEQLRNATTDAEREKIRAQMVEFGKQGNINVQRFFAGKRLDESLVELADKQGRPRLVLKVDGAGAASVEFLDAAGKVMRRIPEG